MAWFFAFSYWNCWPRSHPLKRIILNMSAISVYVLNLCSCFWEKPMNILSDCRYFTHNSPRTHTNMVCTLDIISISVSSGCAKFCMGAIYLEVTTLPSHNVNPYDPWSVDQITKSQIKFTKLHLWDGMNVVSIVHYNLLLQPLLFIDEWRPRFKCSFWRRENYPLCPYGEPLMISMRSSTVVQFYEFYWFAPSGSSLVWRKAESSV